MSEVKGIKELKEVIDGVGVIVALAKEVMADGKVDFTDIAVVAKFQEKLPILLAAVDKANEVGAEVKDISLAEAIEILSLLAEKVKAA